MTPSQSSSEPEIPSVANAAGLLFAEQYGKEPSWIALAPGRVNLIGEHIDYNDGFVLPMAIDRYTAIAASRSDSGHLRIVSREMSEPIDAPANEIRCKGQPDWSAYVLGPLALCAQRGLEVGSLDAVVASDVPTGSGLSSSASVEVATATLAEAICGTKFKLMEKAKLCQMAEHHYAKVPCGIMDQATSTAAIRGHALLLDCRSGSYQQVPFSDPDVAILIANTNVRHALADGQYAQRRSECSSALLKSGVDSFRDLTMADLEKASGQMDPVEWRRARHVVGEIARTLAAAEAMRACDWNALGTLMYESHHSLRNDFEVSCDELDAMVALAEKIGPAGGVYGSRMTGGGFGGSTVTLIAANRADAIRERLESEYRQKTDIEPTLFTTRPAAGSFLARGGAEGNKSET